jgi:hypothetical protein
LVHVIDGRRLSGDDNQLLVIGAADRDELVRLCQEALAEMDG